MKKSVNHIKSRSVKPRKRSVKPRRSIKKKKKEIDTGDFSDTGLYEIDE